MTRKHLLLAALGMTLGAPAFAGGITLHAKVLKAETVTSSAGAVSEHLVAADKALPGDMMVYVLTYRNEGNAPASDVVFDNPIPATMIYRGAGAGGEPDISVDGVHFGRLADLTVGNRPAHLADVTQVRWHLAQPIAAGASGEVSFHATLR